MTSRNAKKRARELMDADPSVKYTQALRSTRTTIRVGHTLNAPYEHVRVDPFRNILIVEPQHWDPEPEPAPALRPRPLPPGARPRTSQHTYRLPWRTGPGIVAAVIADTPWPVTIATRRPHLWADVTHDRVTFTDNILDVTPAPPQHPVVVVVDDDDPYLTRVPFDLLDDPDTAVVLCTTDITNNTPVSRFTTRMTTRLFPARTGSWMHTSPLGALVDLDIAKGLGTSERLTNAAFTGAGHHRGMYVFTATAPGETRTVVPYCTDPDRPRQHPTVTIAVTLTKPQPPSKPVPPVTNLTVRVPVDVTRNVLVGGLPGSGATYACHVLAVDAATRGWDVTYLHTMYRGEPIHPRITHHNCNPRRALPPDEVAANLNTHLTAFTPGTPTHPRMLVVDDPTQVWDHPHPGGGTYRDAWTPVFALYANDPNTALIVRVSDHHPIGWGTGVIARTGAPWANPRTLEPLPADTERRVWMHHAHRGQFPLHIAFANGYEAPVNTPDRSNPLPAYLPAPDDPITAPPGLPPLSRPVVPPVAPASFGDNDAPPELPPLGPPIPVSLADAPAAPAPDNPADDDSPADAPAAPIRQYGPFAVPTYTPPAPAPEPSTSTSTNGTPGTN